MEDRKIIELFWNRSQDAIHAVAEKYGAYCSKIAHNIMQNTLDAEECVNDTYLQAWKNIPPDKPERLDAYLAKITRNLCLSRLRYDSAQKRGGGQLTLVLSELEGCIPAANTVEQEMEERILAQAIQAFLGSLSAEKRNVFLRRYWYMESVKEIAGAYGMSRSKTASMLHRLRNELKQHLEREEMFL